jgi:superfamily II DNA or RNA helicase
VLSATTAFGKTVIGSALIAKRKCNTLILVHLQTLMNQWKNSLEQFLSIDETLPEIPGGRGRKKARSVIGQLGSGKNALSGIVDVASIQSLVHGDEVLDVVKDYGMVIVDECHHVPAVNFERVLRAVNARYIYGLTATPFRQDGQHPLIYMQCGRIRYTVDAKAQAAKRSFEHFVVPCFTGFKKPIAQEETNWTITKIYSDIGANVPRNQQITGDIVEAIKNGRTPIILTQRTDHVEALATLLESKTSAHIVKLTGGSSPKSKNESLNALTTITSNELLAVIATGKYAGEGFDYPRLDTLFLAMPIAWKGLLAQYTGRLHREYPGKRDVIVYDYVDVHVAVLERMYHKRLAAYAQIGYMTMAAHNQTERFGAIYDSNSFIPVMKDDFAGAQKEIIIVSPFMRKKRVESIMEWLVSPIQANAGLTVTVVTRPAENFKEKDRTIVGSCVEYLRSAGIHVVFRTNIHQKFIVIDDRLVWYGSVNLLSFGNAEESVMRLESREIAAELSGLVSWGY